MTNIRLKLAELYELEGDSPVPQPGDEYALVDEFSDMLGLHDWYEWRPDPSQHEPPKA